MVIVTLDKDIFFRNQEQKIQNQLIRSASVLNDLTNYNNKLFQIDEAYQSFMNIGRFEGMNAEIIAKYSQMTADLVSEYDQLLNDISIEFKLSESFMYGIKQIELVGFAFLWL